VARADDGDYYTSPSYNYDPQYGWGPGWGAYVVPGTTAADYDWAKKAKEEQAYQDYFDYINNLSGQRLAGDNAAPQQNPKNGNANKVARAEPSKPPSAATLRVQATAMIQQKKYDQALFLCDQAIASNPNDALAYNERGAAYSWMDQYDKAIESYTKAIQLDPTSAVTWRNRGSVYFHKGEYAKAVADCNEAIRLDGSYTSAYLMRNLANDHLKRDAEAKQEVTSKSALTKATLAGTESAAVFSWKDDSKGVEHYALALLLVPVLVMAWRNRGSVLVLKGE
jgi:tetratricopeptide (TPR) repeat protein